MTTLTVKILNPKARRLLDDLQDVGLIVVSQAPESREKSRRLMELKGLGADMWEKDSADEHLRKERQSWDF